MLANDRPDALSRFGRRLLSHLGSSPPHFSCRLVWVEISSVYIFGIFLIFIIIVLDVITSYFMAAGDFTIGPWSVQFNPPLLLVLSLLHDLPYPYNGDRSDCLVPPLRYPYPFILLILFSQFRLHESMA